MSPPSSESRPNMATRPPTECPNEATQPVQRRGKSATRSFGQQESMPWRHTMTRTRLAKNRPTIRFGLLVFLCGLFAVIVPVVGGIETMIEAHPGEGLIYYIDGQNR